MRLNLLEAISIIEIYGDHDACHPNSATHDHYTGSLHGIKAKCVVRPWGRTALDSYSGDGPFYDRLEMPSMIDHSIRH